MTNNILSSMVDVEFSLLEILQTCLMDYEPMIPSIPFSWGAKIHLHKRVRNYQKYASQGWNGVINLKNLTQRNPHSTWKDFGHQKRKKIRSMITITLCKYLENFVFLAILFIIKKFTSA
jgi:hypothetical protein